MPHPLRPPVLSSLSTGPCLTYLPDPVSFYLPRPSPAMLPALWASVTASDLQNHLQSHHRGNDWPFLMWPRVLEKPCFLPLLLPHICFPGGMARIQLQSLLLGDPLPELPRESTLSPPLFFPQSSEAPVLLRHLMLLWSRHWGQQARTGSKFLYLSSARVASQRLSQFHVHPRKEPGFRRPS